MVSPALLRVSGLTKTYPAMTPGSEALTLFRELELTVAVGEIVALVGESGAGKSTLLHLLAAMDVPTSGEVWCGEQRITGLRAKAAAEFRNRTVGYVWQAHYLLPEFTAAENVAMPLLARGEKRSFALKKAGEWLGRVGLEGRSGNRSGELSGGEQQRVAIARALVTEPSLLLADEPTGNLDAGTAERIFDLLLGLVRESSLGAVVVTHHPELARRCDRVVRLGDASRPHPNER